MRIEHITLMTGDCVTHRLDVLDRAAVAACKALLPHGGTVPGFPAFRVEIHAPVFTVYRGREPLVVCGLGQGEDSTWLRLWELQARFSAVKAEAPRGRWLAVVLLPSLAGLAQTDLGWLADLERCLAAAILEDTCDD